MTGLASETILDWEARHGVGSPIPSSSGEKLYSRADIEAILRFQQSGVAEPDARDSVGAPTPPEVTAALPHQQPDLSREHSISVPPPARAGEPASTWDRASGPGSGEADPSRQLVLVAERDPYSAELIEHFLHGAGYAVTVAFNIENTERRIEQQSPDLVVIEPLMAGGRGFPLVAGLIARAAFPVVILSSVDVTDHPATDGASAIVTKPVSETELISTITSRLQSASRATGGGR